MPEIRTQVRMSHRDAAVRVIRRLMATTPRRTGMTYPEIEVFACRVMNRLYNRDQAGAHLWGIVKMLASYGRCA